MTITLYISSSKSLDSPASCKLLLWLSGRNNVPPSFLEILGLIPLAFVREHQSFLNFQTISEKPMNDDCQKPPRPNSNGLLGHGG